MVDSIRRSGSIGVVSPAGPLRPLERRHQSRKDSRNADEHRSPTPSREGDDEAAERQEGGTSDRCANPPDEEEAQTVKPGRCIDVRI